MRYWRLKGTNRVIAVDVLMVPEWEEITLDQYNNIKEWNKVSKDLFVIKETTE